MLDPFKDLSIEQVADLLNVTQEYRHTGQIPDWVLARKPPASKARTSTPRLPDSQGPQDSEDDPGSRPSVSYETCKVDRRI